MQTDLAPIDQPIDINNLADHVLRDCWFKSTVTGMGDDMHSAPETIARRLGSPVSGRSGQKIEPLIPTKQAAANMNSLSVVYGVKSFPIHTDGAHRIQPPRFVVLVCASPGTSPVPTTLIRFRDLKFTASERTRLEAAPFLVRNGRRSFYSTICSPTPNVHPVRRGLHDAAGTSKRSRRQVDCASRKRDWLYPRALADGGCSRHR